MMRISPDRLMKKSAWAPVLAACVTLTLPCPASEKGTDAEREAGKAIYMAKCSQCHGEAGDGKGPGALFFNPKPRDFTSGAFKIRTTESGELPTDQDLKSIIRKGMPYTGMPAWPRFTESELADIVYFVKTFNADFADTSVHPKTITIPKAPKFSEESASKGKALYEENKCMDCHGRLGRGDGESGPTLKDDWTNPIRPADLTKRWTFRGGPMREDIYRTFVTGLNGTPMPSFANSVKEEDRWHLVDYVYSLSRGDDPGYASMAVAEALPSPMDPAKGKDLFKDAKAALFPVVGQVIEGERDFFPSANAVEVKAVYDSTKIAIMVSWHDMSAQKDGANTPVDPVGAIAAGASAGAAKDTSAASAAAKSPGNLSDAVALELPWKAPEGPASPYFLYGDKKNPVALWFYDMQRTGAKTFLGKGRGNLSLVESGVHATSVYSEGEWSVIFIRDRKSEKGLSFMPGAFVPISVSVWDGLAGETGSRRGVTSWYTLYLKPAATGNPLKPAAKQAALAIVVEFAILFFVRRKFRSA